MAAPVQGVSAAALQRLRELQRPDSGFIRIDDGPEGPSFADTLKQALGEVTQAQDRATNAIDAFVRGEAIELHEVMAAAEEAGIALDLLVEIRNKLTEAYRSVINMQS
ncbi:MAG: flagellar hook-basal body complex protein FliE [Candidatus Cloacimonetes bacterium]|nr:flagellar hook-basal body complex protein FliE [Candidatus Cloacimonadota bacterium]